MSYCDFCKSGAAHQVHVNYHDTAYGFPIEDDNELFGRLLLEINQAGLSWETILKKELGFRNAYAGFDITKIAAFQDSDINRILNDSAVIRNRLKVNAAIYNAQKVLQLQREFGSFKQWLDAHHPLTRVEWTKLFKKNLKFVGGEIVNEFLMSIGYLPGAHDENCPIFVEIKRLKPKWLSYEISI